MSKVPIGSPAQGAIWAAIMVAATILLLAPAPSTAATRLGVKYLDSGTGGACAIRTNQTLWCWGDDEVGSVGDGGPTGAGQIRPTPVRVRSGHGGFFTGATSVFVGAGTNCARRTDGTAWCWGDDTKGSIGDGTTGGASNIRLFPTEVMNGHHPLTGVVTMTIGGWQVCALRTTHTVWCWGGDYAGQLGDGTYGDGYGNRLEPVEVRTRTGPLTGVKAIAAGDAHTCALLTDGTARCWGFDGLGQLGDGTRGNSVAASRPESGRGRRPDRRPPQGRHGHHGRRLVHVRPSQRRQRMVLGRQPVRATRRRHRPDATAPGTGPDADWSADQRGPDRRGLRPHVRETGRSKPVVLGLELRRTVGYGRRGRPQGGPSGRRTRSRLHERREGFRRRRLDQQLRAESRQDCLVLGLRRPGREWRRHRIRPRVPGKGRFPVATPTSQVAYLLRARGSSQAEPRIGREMASVVW